jgi:hypothetical protein
MRVVSKAERIQEEARSLWIEVYGEAPAPDMDGRQMLDLLLTNMEPQTYTRLRAATRSRNLTWPRKS